nr:hypothetical protein [Tanacetum cinerariifolium]
MSIILTGANVCIGHPTNDAGAEINAKLKESRTPLLGFSSEVSYLIRTINLNVTKGEPRRLRTILIEKPSKNAKGWKKHEDQQWKEGSTSPKYKHLNPKEQPTKAGKKAKDKRTKDNITWEGRDEGVGTVQVVIHDDYLDQTITIGGNLSVKCRSGLIEILRKHVDAFAWTSTDMTGIPRFISEHELKTNPHIEPRVQRKWSIDSERRKVIKDKVEEWLKARIVRKVRYPTWVANPVLVKKPDNRWRMCIDFKDLNKACLKDLYLLPEIDWKIKSLMGFKYKCFLDAYKGYHRIQMTKMDEEKMAFHTDEESFVTQKCSSD